MVFSLGFLLLTSWRTAGSLLALGLMWRQLHSVSFCASWCCKSRHFVIPPSWILNEHGGQQKTLLVGWYIWSSLGGEAALRRGNESCQCIIIASEQELVQNTGLSFFPFKNVVAVTGGLGTVHSWHQITDWGHQGRSNTSNETLISVISYFSLSHISWVLPAYISSSGIIIFSLTPNISFLMSCLVIGTIFLDFYESHVLKYVLICCIIYNLSIISILHI